MGILETYNRIQRGNTKPYNTLLITLFCVFNVKAWENILVFFFPPPTDFTVVVVVVVVVVAAAADTADSIIVKVHQAFSFNTYRLLFVGYAEFT